MNAGTRWLGRSMLLAGLALGALSVPRHAAAEGSFVVSVVDSAGVTGYGASIALTPAGAPLISHYAAGELRLAEASPSGWSSERLGGARLSRTSLALASDGRVFVAFAQSFAAGGGLRIAVRSSSGWSVETVDPEYFSGAYADLVLDSLDQPHVVYTSNTCNTLAYLWRDASGTHTSFPNGTCLRVTYPSIALDSRSRAHFSYEWNTGMFHREPNDQGGWTGTAIEGVTFGAFSSIAVDSLDEPRVAFRNPVTGRLRYAKRSGGIWQVVTVDSGNTGDQPSLALDRQGRAHIAYLHQPTGDLRYAVEHEAGWNIAIVDSAGDVGHDPSLALDAEGRAHIAYRDNGRRHLRYAGPPPPATAVPERPRSAFDLRVFPNPASSEVTVEFAGLPDGPVEIEVLDLMGRARRLDHRLASRGRLRSTMDLNGLPDGVYFVRARASGTRMVRRLVVTARR
jgi:hypothetical protein